MTLYRYKGINRFGKRVQGEMQALSEAELLQRLRSADIDLVSCKVKSRRRFEGANGRKVQRREVIVLTSQLRQLLGAGVPLMDVVDDLRREAETESVRQMLSVVYDAMEGGQSFSQALRVYESVLGSVYITLVAVGEKTGQMVTILTQLESMLKWEDGLIVKAKKVMIYPAIVATVVLSVIFMMMLFVVPELVTFVAEMGGDLGWATRSLMAVSGFIQDAFWGVLLVPLVLWGLVVVLHRRSEAFRIGWDRSVFRWPLIGGVTYKLKVARLASTLGVMQGAGVHFNECMAQSARVVNNAYLEKAVAEAMRLIEEGETIHKAFAQAGVFPPMAVRMMKVGEQSGRMRESLEYISAFYDAEAKEAIDRVEPAIEPVLTILMAVVVGWVMLAVLGPVYDTISKVP
ncbi:MAG: type II secretion system F family protein [Hydrogenovibrio sp.]